MSDMQLINDIAEMMRGADQGWNGARENDAGHPPEWAIWYAEFLCEPLSERLGVSFTHSKLIYCLMDADEEHETTRPEEEWSFFFARFFVERFAPSDDSSSDKLILYQTVGCPYCRLVRAAIDRLGIAVELRDVAGSRDDYADLLAARNRATVPVLRIIPEDGEERWMPESRDIVAYLERTYGEQ